MFVAQPGFLPARFSNVKAWLEDRSAKTFNGADLAELGDIISTNDAAQVTASIQPGYDENAINGMPTPTYDGSEYFNWVTPSDLGILNADYEIIIVFRSSLNGTQFLMGGATEQFEIHLDGSEGVRFIPVTGKFADIGSPGDYTDGNPHVVSARVASNVATVSVDGVDGPTPASPARSGNNSPLLIGSRSTGIRLTGDTPLVVIAQPNFSIAQRAYITDYTKRRYGIA